MTLLNQYRGLRREIYVLFFGRVVTNLGAMIWPVLTMILSQKLGFSASEISYFFVGSSVIMLPANLIGGRLTDRFNKKWLIVICDCVSVLCYFISSAIPLGMGTILLFVFAGLFQSVEGPAYEALFADLSATRDRERAYSLGYLGANLGLVLSPTIAGILFKEYLWLSFLISGISIAMSTVLIAVLIRDVTPVEDTGEESAYQAKKEGAGVLAVLKENPLLLLYLLCGAFYSAAYAQYNYIMPLDMAAAHGDEGAVLYGTVSSLNCITVVLFTFLFLDIFNTMGTVIGVCEKAGYVDEKGNVDGINECFMADSIGTICGAALGTSTTTTCVESAAGEADGGRTGLTAFSTAIFFVIALLFAPLFLAVPAAATAPALIVVGMMMMTPVLKINWENPIEALPAFITMVVMPFCFSISDGILIGMISYVALNAFCGNLKDITPTMWVLAILFVLRYIFI